MAQTVSIKARKKVQGAKPVPGQFTFGAYTSSGRLLDEATNDRNGTVTLCVTPQRAGDATVYIREITPTSGEWKTDRSEERVSVSARYDRRGHLNSSVSYPCGVPEFVNTKLGGYMNLNLKPNGLYTIVSHDGSYAASARADSKGRASLRLPAREAGLGRCFRLYERHTDGTPMAYLGDACE